MDEEKELEYKLKQYRSNFDLLKEVEKMTKDSVEILKDKLLDEYNSTPYDTNMETIRAWNLISFLSFIFGDEAEAFEYNSKVLELDMNNLIGLCNKAWFFLKRKEKYSIVRCLCEQLKEKLPFEEYVLVAKAEIAFCYSRFGIKRYDKANELFKEVIDACNGLQNVDGPSTCNSSDIANSRQSNIPNENICVWTFGYALTFKRLLNISNVHDLSSRYVSKQAHVSACDLYSRIIGMSGKSKCLDRYKARSYVELGNLVYNARKSNHIFPRGVKDILPDHQDLWQEPETYFTKGINICPNDVFSLERSGRFFRYINQIDKSIEYLKKALEIRDTAFSHHHMSLSLKRMLEMTSSNTCRSVAAERRKTVSDNLFETVQKLDDSSMTYSTGHDTNDQRTPAMNMIKSPEEQNFIDRVQHEQTIVKIIFHLDKSVEKSHNSWAIYDKGLLYRQIGQSEKALETFQELIRNKGGYCSLVQLSNAYEQAGLCLYDILHSCIEDTESLECDMRQYFKKSIEISCMLVSKIPFLKYCWVSAPTLHGFLLGKAETKETLKDLSFLFKKIENYGAAIDVLNQLKKLTEDDIETVKINLELVENCLHLRNYDDAVLTLDMIMCLPNRFSLIDETLYLQVHIDGGVDALQKGDTEMARLRFRNALDFTRCNKDGNENNDDHDEQETDREEGEYDLFLLCNADIEERIEGLLMVMEEFTLRVALNFCHVVPGALKLSGLSNLMRRSKHFLIVCDEKPLDKQMLYNFEVMQSVIFERECGHTVVLSIAQDVSVPKHLSHLPKTFMEMNFDVEDAGTKTYNKVNICEKMKDLLFKLARSK